MCIFLLKKIFNIVNIDCFSFNLELCTYQRKSALGGDEEGKVELFFNGYDNQHIRENAENYKGEMLTQPMIYQGMYEYHKTVNEFTKFI